MRARIAKKVMRCYKDRPFYVRHKIAPTITVADLKLRRRWRRSFGVELTRGYRWGKWDPKRSCPPWELPF